MNKFSLLLFAVVISFTACKNQNQTIGYQKTIDSLKAIIAEDHSSEVTAIMKADSTWDKVSEAKSAEGWLSFYADDAIMMPPNETVCKDKASREASIKNMFAVPGMSLRFQSQKAEVARAGDLGYATGVYQWKSKDPKGNDYNETGKYTEVWKKQADGSWKCIADIWNSDPQAAK
jgi:ketosteroid isomerase-like protein